MRWVAVAVLIGACGSPALRPESSATQPRPAVTAPAGESSQPIASRAGAGDVVPVMPAGYHCIVNPHETIIVLDFEIDVATSVSSPTGAVTDRFRAEVTATPLPLSKVRLESLDQRLIGNCDTPPHGDAICMARIGKQLNTDWLLWGTVEPDGGGFVVEAQLIPVANPSASRSVRYRFVGAPDVETHKAWLTLSAR